MSVTYYLSNHTNGQKVVRSVILVARTVLSEVFLVPLGPLGDISYFEPHSAGIRVLLKLPSSDHHLPPPPTAC